MSWANRKDWAARILVDGLDCQDVDQARVVLGLLGFHTYEINVTSQYEDGMFLVDVDHRVGKILEQDTLEEWRSGDVHAGPCITINRHEA